MNCQHCEADNKGGWFYCRSCGLRASKPLYNPSVIVRDSNFATAIRKDLINFKLLTSTEKKYLFKYHLDVYSKISKFLNFKERQWLASFI